MTGAGIASFPQVGFKTPVLVGKGIGLESHVAYLRQLPLRCGSHTSLVYFACELLGIKPPEMMALGVGVRTPCGADAEYLAHDGFVRLSLVAEDDPVVERAAFNRVVNRGGTRQVGFD